MLADPELREALYCIRCGACPERVPGVRQGRRARLWLGIPRPNRRCCDAGDGGRTQGEGPALRVDAVRSVPRRLSAAHRHSADAAEASQRRGGGPGRDPRTTTNGVVDDAIMAQDGGRATVVHAGGQGRLDGTVAAIAQGIAAMAAAAARGVDAVPRLPPRCNAALPRSMAQERRRPWRIGSSSWLASAPHSPLRRARPIRTGRETVIKGPPSNPRRLQLRRRRSC